MKKIGIKLAVSAILSVTLAAVSAIFIPMPYGPIIAALLGIGEGFYIRSFFTTLK